MYTAFHSEFEKIALQRGEGSRGGKVAGRTKSGEPIYASSKKKGKSDWTTRAAVGGALLGAAALGGLRFLKKRQLSRFKWAAHAYSNAGGPTARGKGKVWEEFKKAGDAWAGKNNSRWARDRDRYHQTHKKYKKYQKASDAYHQAGGPAARGKKKQWDDYTRAGDDFYGDSHAWGRAKAGAHAQHRAYKSRHGSGYGSGRGSGYGSGRARSGAATSAGAKAYAHIPGLGKVKTKKDAKKAYMKAAMKNHPDRGGSTEKMQDINRSWGDFKNSPLYEKLAMAHWSKIASVLIR